jgi:hypothetical protein
VWLTLLQEQIELVEGWRGEEQEQGRVFFPTQLAHPLQPEVDYQGQQQQLMQMRGLVGLNLELL